MKSSNSFFTALTSILFFIFIVILVYFFLFTKKTPVVENITTTQNQYETTHFSEFDISLNPTITTIAEDSYFFITKDGIALKDINNETIWQETYSFKTLHTKNSSNYIVTTELTTTNTELHLFNINGLVYTIPNIVDEISFVDVNDNGYLSVIFTKKNGYTLNVYSDIGDLLFSHIFEDGYVIPLSSTLSNDNRTLLINQLDSSKLNISSLNVFFDIEDFETNGMFAVQTFDNDYFYKIGFLDDTTLGTISNNHIYISEVINNTVEITSTFELSNRIKFAFIENEHIVVVYDEATDANSQYQENTIQIINKNGSQNTLLPSSNITYINNSNDVFIVGSNSTFYFYDYKGNPIWSTYSEFIPKHVIALEKGTLAGFSGVDKLKFIKYTK